jgi:hypothetical protein
MPVAHKRLALALARSKGLRMSNSIGHAKRSPERQADRQERQFF